MLIIAGVADCVSVVEQARAAPGCLEFSIAADTLEDDRIVIFERWESEDGEHRRMETAVLRVRGDRGSHPLDERGLSSSDIAMKRRRHRPGQHRALCRWQTATSNAASSTGSAAASPSR